MPLVDTLVQEAMNISQVINRNETNLRMALEAEAQTRQAEKEARQAYEAAEAEVTFETMFNANGKNAETRKAEVEAALVAARRDGDLAGVWATLNAAIVEHEGAEMALEQMKVSFRAVSTAAELQAAMLRALAPR